MQNILVSSRLSHNTSVSVNTKGKYSSFGHKADCLQQGQNTHQQFVSMPYVLDANKGRRNRQAENWNVYMNQVGEELHNVPSAHCIAGKQPNPQKQNP